jgi:hypothetical protein
VRYLCRFATIAIGTVILLGVERPAAAHYPLECSPEHAKDDFKNSALVVIGRVTTVERFRASPSAASTASEKEPTEFFYLATVTVGQTLKGKVKPGDEVLFYTGSYRQRKEDNTAPTALRVANTHPAWTLDYDHIYLLALNPAGRSGEWNAEARRDGRWIDAALEKREVWEPRSCHCSVHEITVRNRKEPGGIADGMETIHLIPETYVTLYFDRWRAAVPKENRIFLSEFIAAQEKGRFPGHESQNAPAPPNSQNANPSKVKQ